ncbi:hypothetical protein BDZ45DRAFT_740468 [Acephala macrosclerotiorum]|nr:hypothetical protein BDZ45DRAFT_740468 [Acephala macrosclerotiorum]
MSQPLILSLRLDTASEKLLTSLRIRFFPQSINYREDSLRLKLYYVQIPNDRNHMSIPDKKPHEAYSMVF